MGYKRAEEILPKELLNLIQKYIDGQYLYIPRKEENRKTWGEISKSKELTYKRNLDIFSRYKSGINVKQLANEFYLSEKAIYKIIAACTREAVSSGSNDNSTLCLLSEK